MQELWKARAEFWIRKMQNVSPAIKAAKVNCQRWWRAAALDVFDVHGCRRDRRCSERLHGRRYERIVDTLGRSFSHCSSSPLPAAGSQSAVFICCLSFSLLTVGRGLPAVLEASV